MFNILTKIILVISFLVLTSCAKMSPLPLSSDSIDKSVDEDFKKISKIKEQNEILQNNLEIDLYTAIALAIQNNKDLKVKLFETALADRKVEEVKFDMLPKMSANAGYTGSEKYQSSTSANVASDDRAAEKSSTFSTSRNRDVVSQDIGIAWNALDFGLSYIRAKQTGDKFLIATEIEKKTANNIAREVVRAYWSALTADKLIKKYDPLIKKVESALNDSQLIEEMLLQKPMDALLYQKELLDIKRALISQKQTLINAKVELGTFMGLLPNQEYKLVSTDEPINILDMKIEKMEKHALTHRAELLENRYQERISVAETKIGLRSLLPSYNLNASFTSSSNDYLQNKTNFEFGSSVGANLLNVFRAPAIKQVNEANTEIIREQRLALSMTVLSQVHLAKIDYQMSIEEYDVAQRYFDVSTKIANQVRNAQKIARFGELELIREEASNLVAELRSDIAFSKLQHSIAQVYTTVGIDITSKDNVKIGTEFFAQDIKNKFKSLGKKYTAKVNKPIQKQNPIAIQLNDNYKKFAFSDETFELEGHGTVQYSAKLADNQDLPNWIEFLPTQRAFLIDTSLKDDVYELDIIVNAKNTNSTIDDQFTLVVDHMLKDLKETANLILNFATDLNEKTVLTSNLKTQ